VQQYYFDTVNIVNFYKLIHHTEDIDSNRDYYILKLGSLHFATPRLVTTARERTVSRQKFFLVHSATVGRGRRRRNEKPAAGRSLNEASSRFQKSDLTRNPIQSVVRSFDKPCESHNTSTETAFAVRQAPILLLGLASSSLSPLATGTRSSHAPRAPPAWFSNLSPLFCDGAGHLPARRPRRPRRRRRGSPARCDPASLHVARMY
jgi:hypothetical protein